MIRGNQTIASKFGAANVAIATALLFSAPVAFAQETATAPAVETVAPPPVVQSTPAPAATSTPAPAPTTVAPPPVVPTISAAPTEAEAPAPRRAAARATARPAKTSAAPERVRAVAPAPAAVSTPVNAPERPTVINAPVLDETATVAATPIDTAPVAPAAPSEPTQIANGTSDDWMIYGGLAAALGLAGLGGVLASRRRRTRSQQQQFVENEPAYTAPVAATEPTIASPSPVHVQSEPVYAAPVQTAAPVTAPLINRASFADQHLPPVTDPLFAHETELGPVTDPLFMHKAELPPVTDPMFADKEEYAGRSAAGAEFDKRKTSPDEDRKPLHEFEPAE